MTPSRLRVRRVAVALATATCLLGGMTLPALAGDKEKKPPPPDAEPAPPPPAPAPEQQSQAPAPAAPAPSAPAPSQGGSKPKRRQTRQPSSGGNTRTQSESEKPKKPETSDSAPSGSDTSGSGSSGAGAVEAQGQPTGQGAATPQPAPAQPTPAPGGGQTSTPSPDSGSGSDRRRRSAGGRRGEVPSSRSDDSEGSSQTTGIPAPVLDTTTGGAPVVAPLGPVGVTAVGREQAGGGSGSEGRPGAGTDFRADDDGGALPPVTRTVSKIVEVVPGPLKAALAGLALVALLLAAHGQVTSARNRRLKRQREQLLDEVGLLQAALLPEVPPRLGDLVSTVAYRPAEGPAAGGDFYDAFAFDGGRVGVIVGDISGHGREALARTALMRYTLRAYLDAGLEPRAALKVAGSVLDDDLGSDFATVAVAVYDPEAGTLTYATAGHPPPILLGPPAHEPVTSYASPPVGVGATTGLRQTTLSFPAGAIACFYTDGMTDARVGHDLLGRERLAELLAELGPAATAPELLERVAALTDRTPDDMAACILHADGAGAGRLRVEELEVSRADLAGPGVVRFLRECGAPMADVPTVMRAACDTARESGSAVLRVRMGDWRPGVDVLPGNVQTLAAARRSAAALAHTS